jgi:hypothetical protein
MSAIGAFRYGDDGRATNAPCEDLNRAYPSRGRRRAEADNRCGCSPFGNRHPLPTRLDADAPPRLRAQVELVAVDRRRLDARDRNRLRDRTLSTSTHCTKTRASLSLARWR